MLFCNNCGQCSHISEEQFYRYDYGSSSQTAYLNPETGEAEDWGDTETDNFEAGQETFCPHCHLEDVNINWNGELSEAMEKRAEYEENIRRHNRTKKIEKSGWDSDNND